MKTTQSVQYKSMNLTIDTQLSEIVLSKDSKTFIYFSIFEHKTHLFIFMLLFFIRSTTIFLEEKKLTIRKNKESLSTNM